MKMLALHVPVKEQIMEDMNEGHAIHGNCYSCQVSGDNKLSHVEEGHETITRAAASSSAHAFKAETDACIDAVKEPRRGVAVRRYKQ